jgi:hypothetical protein
MTKGRPLKFKSVEELQSKIDEYFDYCDKKVIKRIVNKNSNLVSEITQPYTITGLASFLEVDRHTLINYTRRDEGFFTTIKNAKAKIEADYENRAIIGESNPIITIFTLKNNFNWKDKIETDLTTGGKPIYLPSEIIKKNETPSSSTKDSK